MKLGDFLTSINYNKKNLFEENENFAEKSYVPFVINRCLSYFPDTILHANMMNLHTGVSKRMNYEYYLHSIRKGKRFSKTLKSEVHICKKIKKYYAESIGTFSMVFCGTSAMIINEITQVRLLFVFSNYSFFCFQNKGKGDATSPQ